MQFLISVLRSVPLFYVVLMWPGRYVLWGLWDSDAYYPALMYDSGVWSVRLLIAALAVTPTLLLINRIGRGQALGRWLLPRRRHLGIASALYAGLHLIHYVRALGGLDAIIFDLRFLAYQTGWASLILLLVLAATSNARAVRAMGKGWKRLHLWVYPAGVLALWHWYLLDWYTGRILFWCGVFMVPIVAKWVLRRVRVRFFA
ncbi:ferric reductase-like transmembrane domain-containing protein [uncultured Tateyamaria sp.]|uniref:ferric reductase-like transmembrane domain-containing protein n=1 Tax=uncultured Tateyamaria sp. TaxID=455651 RepID=UPI00260531E8|nr:ferric reductase-like transmembrane domain-containing protein [uncultured Tateyamaria sp.]